MDPLNKAQILGRVRVPQRSNLQSGLGGGLGGMNRARSTLRIPVDTLPSPSPSVDESVPEESVPLPRQDPTQFILAVQNDLTSFRAFNELIDKSFWDRFSTSSTALDIIAVYLKGQKILYIEAKTHCEQRLHALMLPAIFISALCTVISLALKDYEWGTILVSGLTALNSFILSLINFLKLDAKAEAHKTTSYQFDKLQSLCEFHSGKVLFFENNTASAVVDDIEKKVAEIKDTNQFILPEAIRYRFPTLFSKNVFTEVKMIENDENKVKNMLQSIFLEYEALKSIQEPTEEQQARLAKLEALKKERINQFLDQRSKYLELDKLFNKEITDQITASRKRWAFCGWLKT